MRINTYVRFEWTGKEYVEVDSISYKYEGSIDLMGGGGGSSGEIGYPSYMERVHEQWLDQTGTDDVDNSINDLIDVAHGSGGNPYESENAFDPNAVLTLVSNSPLSRLNEQYTSAKTLIDDISASTDWTAFLTSANTKWTDIDFLADLDTAIAGLLTAVESALSSTSITDMVTSFETNKKARFLRDVGVWSASMADVNAVHTSSFIIGLALQQIEFSNSVDQYERELKGNIYNNIVVSAIQTHIKTKGLFLLQGSALQQQLSQLKDTLTVDLARIKIDVERMTMIAKKEQTEHDLAIDVDEALWDFEVYMYAGNLLGAISGAAAGRKPMTATKGQSVMGGALTGASIGAEVGGPKGAAIGGVAGALLGWAFG